MPPKQVYGKRTKTTTTRSTYSKFISPDKDELARGKSNSAGAKKHPAQDTKILEIEQQLEALNIRDATKKPSELPKQLELELELEPGARKENAQPTAQVKEKVAVSVTIERRLESLPLHEDVIVFDERGVKKNRESRKALESRDTNADIESKPTRIKSKKVKSKTREQSTKKEDLTANTENTREDDLELEQTSIQDHKQAAASHNDHDAQGHIPDEVPPSTPIRSVKSMPLRQIHPLSPPCSPLSDDIYTTYTSPLLALSDQRRIIPFGEWSAKLDACVDVAKIAEASYSEVYRLTMRDAIPGCSNESVLKLVPLKTLPNAPLPSESTDKPRRGRKVDVTKQLAKERTQREADDMWKSPVEDVLGEVRLLQNLNYIPGFTNFRELTILQGRPSTSFGRAWKEWNKARPREKKSEFPDPNKKASYEDIQLWAVIEMQDAGTDCGKVIEAGGINTVWEVWDIFWGVCLSVAKAEEACRFEHRDLHMDNICIRTSTPDDSLIDPVIRNPLKRKLGFTSLETTVIDYTLSRADIINTSHSTPSASSPSSLLPPSTPRSSAEKDPEVAYLNLDKDACLFQGDSYDEYQYEIYRYMRGVVYQNDPLAQDADLRTEEELQECTPDTPRPSASKQDDTNTTTPETPRRSSPRKHQFSDHLPRDNIWKRFHPKTNLVWAHFILYSLLENIESREPASLSREDVMCNIRDVADDDAERIHKKAMRLHKILCKLAHLLEPEQLGHKSRLGSVRDVVILALETGWLGAGDVSGGVV